MFSLLHQIVVHVRRLHLGHGHAARERGRYDYVEAVIDQALLETYQRFFAEAAGRGFLAALRPEERRFYEKMAKRDWATAEENTLKKKVYPRLAREACQIAEEKGVSCLIVKDAKGIARPVFVAGERVYVTGFWGQERDAYTGSAHPTLFLFEKPLPPPLVRRMVEGLLGVWADENELEDSIGSYMVECIRHGGCEVTLDVGERGINRIYSIRVVGER